jgi:uncharacterized surface protein with fasciclin (FAS1) repeats
LHFYQVMIKHILFILLSIFFLTTGCEMWPEHEKYSRPDWLPGKLYTTVSVQENLTLFTECLQLAGLDKIIDVSGSWSVFAPTDEAMKQFLSEKNYTSIYDIPPDELERITTFHIVQSPWTLDQLKILGINGWKTGKDNASNPYAFKRVTMLQNPVEKYWIRRVKKKELIVLDSINSTRYKRVFVQSKKYVPIFYEEYMKINGITTEDFRFYFGRAFEQGAIYFAGAKILKSDILAENGIIHIIDKVVSPMMNGQELLEKETPNESYKLFLDLVYWYYPQFKPNITATYNQPDVRQGGIVDTLWDLNYPKLAFDLHSERIFDLNQTLIRHNGLFVPTDDALQEFIDGTLTSKSGFPHWGDYKSLPPDIVALIVGQNFRTSPIYPSTNQYRQIFKNSNRYRQKEESIIKKEFGSNCTFIGLDSYVPDRAFTSVTGPVFCRPNYTTFRKALLFSGAIDDIASHPGKLLFFPIPDYALNSDSSLFINWISQDEDIYNFQVYNKLKRQMENVGRNTLRSWILNQVGTSVTEQNGKQTIRTLGGRNIIWDHMTNTIRGTLPSTEGYNSNVTAICTPVLLEEPTDNGKTYSVRHWFRF